MRLQAQQRGGAATASESAASCRPALAPQHTRRVCPQTETPITTKLTHHELARSIIASLAGGRASARDVDACLGVFFVERARRCGCWDHNRVGVTSMVKLWQLIWIASGLLFGVSPEAAVCPHTLPRFCSAATLPTRIRRGASRKQSHYQFAPSCRNRALTSSKRPPNSLVQCNPNRLPVCLFLSPFATDRRPYLDSGLISIMQASLCSSSRGLGRPPSCARQQAMLPRLRPASKVRRESTSAHELQSPCRFL